MVCLLGALLATGGLLAVALLTGEPPNGHGMPHPRISEMRAGGPATARVDDVSSVGFGIGALLIVSFVLCICIGVSRRQQSRTFLAWLAAGGAASLAVWTALVLAYRSDSGHTEPDLVLGLPVATAWMLYGLWAAPGVFTLLYSAGFERWIHTPEDQQRFEAILAEHAPGAPSRETTDAVSGEGRADGSGGLHVERSA